MAITADRVLETSASSGSGDITLAGAVSGYRTFASAITVGRRFYYCLEHSDLAAHPQWEVGVGVLSASTTLQRETVLESSNSGAPVTFSTGGIRAFITWPGKPLPPKDISILAPGTITWDVEKDGPNVIIDMSSSGSVTLAIQNFADFDLLTAWVQQGLGGGNTITFDAGIDVATPGNAGITYSSAGGAVDLLVFTKVPTTLVASVGDLYATIDKDIRSA